MMTMMVDRSGTARPLRGSHCGGNARGRPGRVGMRMRGRGGWGGRRLRDGAGCGRRHGSRRGRGFLCLLRLGLLRPGPQEPRHHGRVVRLGAGGTARCVRSGHEQRDGNDEENRSGGDEEGKCPPSRPDLRLRRLVRARFGICVGLCRTRFGWNAHRSPSSSVTSWTSLRRSCTQAPRSACVSSSDPRARNEILQGKVTSWHAAVPALVLRISPPLQGMCRPTWRPTIGT